MFTFTRTNNTVKVGIDVAGSTDDVIFLSPASLVGTRNGQIYINQGKEEPFYPVAGAFIVSPLSVNGRPADDAVTVAEWLIDTYFYGPDYPISGGSSWPVDYATSGLQTSQLSEIQSIDTRLETLNDKTASNLVTEAHDSKEFVYYGNGDIDYISYKLGVTEVARITFNYTGDDLTSMVKT
jgi:hypothetical protein